ncbi:MAG TPA: phosphoribosyltransferase family protein [Candidatus Sulfotelmatobacter sp.]|nr:phosphoribosyltransferase family protein [Candidatus Sulfotelmatobacter sp.]
MSSIQAEYPRILLSAEQIRKRVQEMARQISIDFQGKNLYVVAVMENGFIFMADLVRELSVPVVCQFVKAEFDDSSPSTTQIFFSPEIDVKGQHVLLVEALVQSGVTSEFLMRNLAGRGAASVKLAVLLDKQSARRVSLQPDYFGFLMNESFVVGYGLGEHHFGRNLPYIAGRPEPGTP